MRSDDRIASGVLFPGELLDGKGALVQSGYAFSQVKTYDRSAIRGKRLRIKEWDYYYFGDDRRMVALTIADNSYMSLASVSVLDFERYSYVTKSKMGFMPRGKLGFPSNCSDGSVAFDKGGVKISFVNDNGARRLTCEFKNYVDKKDLLCEIELGRYDDDNITVATPFKKRKCFYYNTKVNCLTGSGWLRVGDDKYTFSADASGGLDWGRGVWPYKNVWYWSSLSTTIDGTPFGLNLGYGFGRPVATENVIFYGGKAHKIDNVQFDIPFTAGELDYLKPWRITDDKGRLDLQFFPIIDRADKMNAVIVSTDQHQVFGKFYGKATLDDGTIIDVSDKIGFAEHVKNKW